MVPDVLIFEDTDLEVIDRDGQVWLRLPQIGAALGYADAQKAINNLYRANADEFTEEMTTVVKLPDLHPRIEGAGEMARTVKLTVQGQLRDVRVFSLRGAHLLGMFARTDRAKALRRWVLDVLEGIAAAPAEASAPGLPTSVAHRADHIVAATRSFNGLLRAAQGLRLDHAHAARSANAATLRHTGIDLMEELGVTDADLAASAPAPSADTRLRAIPHDDGTAGRVSTWLDAPEQATRNHFESHDILTGAIGLTPDHPDFHGAQTRLGYIMARLGWRKQRMAKGQRRYVYVRPER